MARTVPKPKIDKAGGTQPAATSPDVVYGQGQANVEAQNQIGLPDSRGVPASQPTLQGPEGVISAGTPQVSPDVLEAARQYTPDIMPLEVTAGLYRTLDSVGYRQDQKVSNIKDRLLAGLVEAQSEDMRALGSHIKSRQRL